MKERALHFPNDCYLYTVFLFSFVLYCFLTKLGELRQVKAVLWSK